MQSIFRLLKPSTCSQRIVAFKSKLVLTPDEPPPIQNYTVNPFYEPAYLETIRDPDVFPVLDLKLRGYDFQVLDTFTRYVTKYCRSLKIKHAKTIVMPARILRVKQLKPNSEVVDIQFDLYTYERILKLVEVKECLLGLLYEFTSCALPMGVSMQCRYPDPADEDYRYIPDLELKQTQEELKALNEGMDLEDLSKFKKKEMTIEKRQPIQLLFGQKRNLPLEWIS
ncbi:hypothetical protein ACOME3_006159 [Neoechinorhynchus agilis]